ncbi:MAG: hypothetical protein U0271_36295 [Polyangiaceae bacterium]
MRIEADVHIPFPLELVYATQRDRLIELVPHLPNIKSITVTKRVERGEDVDFVNEWVGGADIPSVIRSVIKESMLRWTDYATWEKKSYAVIWRTDVHAFPGAVRSEGRNTFSADGDGTKFSLRGELVVDASKVRGVPRFLEKTASETAEKTIVGSIKDNVIATARGVEKLLRATAG